MASSRENERRPKAVRPAPGPDAPGKSFFKLGDIAGHLGVPKHVVKYWEGAFKMVRPMRVGGRRNLYTPADLELFARIKRLVHDERYTVEGAKRKLLEEGHKIKRAPRRKPPEESEADESEAGDPEAPDGDDDSGADSGASGGGSGPDPGGADPPGDPGTPGGSGKRPARRGPKAPKTKRRLPLNWSRGLDRYLGDLDGGDPPPEASSAPADPVAGPPESAPGAPKAPKAPAAAGPKTAASGRDLRVVIDEVRDGLLAIKSLLVKSTGG